jgi:hypothetical protein
MNTSASSQSQSAQSTPADTSASKDEWRGAIAFANIGLAGSAVRGGKWKCRRGQLLKQFTKLLLYNGLKVIGICLNEVGNLSDLLDQKDRQIFDELIQEAFNNAGATEHGPARIIWSEGETVSAWRHEQAVKDLSPLTNIDRVHPWRTLDRLEVMGATVHGPCSLLVYNNHQPSSPERVFPSAMRCRLCRATMQDAIKIAQSNKHNIGFTFGGDANCNLATWQPVLNDISEYKLTFQEAELTWGINRKPGDLMVTAGIEGLVVHDTNCDVENRCPEHDCMVLAWCYRPRATRAQLPLPARPNTVQSLSAQLRDQVLAAAASDRSKAAAAAAAAAAGTQTCKLIEVKARWSQQAPAEQTVPDGCQMVTAMRTDGQMGATDECYRRKTGSATDGCADEVPRKVTFETEVASLKKKKTEDPQKDSSTEPSAWGLLEPIEATSEAPSSEGASEADYFSATEDATPTTYTEDEHIDHIGRALVISASATLPVSDGMRKLIGAAIEKDFEDLCTKDERLALEEAAQLFFCKKKDTGVPEHGSKAGVKPQHKSAWCLKSKTECADAWQLIFERRRLEENDDTAAISDPDVLSRMFTAWMDEWIARELTLEQRKRARNRQTSIFAAYIKNEIGGKHFVMAVWQTGITWAPSPELVENDYAGALEHVATNFTSWVQRVASSIRAHKQDPKTVEARTRSGKAWVGIVGGSARGLP